MNPSILLLSGLIALTTLSLVLWASFLWMGLRWAEVPNATLGRVATVTASAYALQMAASIALRLASQAPLTMTPIFLAMELVAAAIIPCSVIRFVFRTSLIRTAQAWVLTLIPKFGVLLFVLLVLRPFVFEAYVCPTNSMAPTLLGKHWQDSCPECGAPNYCTPTESGYFGAQKRLRICENFHVCENHDPGERAIGGDQFAVLKTLEPQRWDLIVFRLPEEPSINYVKRLVGLPGEEIVIRDGAVWADGRKLTTPASIQNIEYVAEDFVGSGGPGLWGSPERPATLGDNEYFVLGDFSRQARDSRYWDQGAPGHPPYAVPESHLIGVVTQTYWPPRRWRSFR